MHRITPLPPLRYTSEDTAKHAIEAKINELVDGYNALLQRYEGDNDKLMQLWRMKLRELDEWEKEIDRRWQATPPIEDKETG